MNSILKAIIFVLLATWPTRASGPPPEIRAIVEKTSRGEPVTPEEARKLADFIKAHGPTALFPDGAVMPSAPPSKPPKSGSGKSTPPTFESLGLCRERSERLETGAPTRASYLKMVARVLASERSSHPNIAAALEKATPDRGAAVVMVPELVRQNAAGMALWVVARAAEAAPDDALAASNLGALLTARARYADADLALRWAESLAPDHPTILTNRGWVAFGAGDRPAARLLFERAAAASGARLVPQTILGEALCDACDKKASAAIDGLRAAAAAGGSEVALAALQALAPESPGPWATTRPDALDLPAPPVRPDLEAAPSDRRLAHAMRESLAEKTRTGDCLASPPPAARLKGAPTYVPVREAERFLALWSWHALRLRDGVLALSRAIDAERDAYHARLKPLYEQYDAMMRACGADGRCQARVDKERCEASVGVAVQTQPRAAEAFGAQWRLLAPLLNEAWTYLNGALEHMHAEQILDYGQATQCVVYHVYAEALKVARDWNAVVESQAKARCGEARTVKDLSGSFSVLGWVEDKICDLVKFDLATANLQMTVDCEHFVVTSKMPLGQRGVFVETTFDSLVGEATVFVGFDLPDELAPLDLLVKDVPGVAFDLSDEGIHNVRVKTTRPATTGEVAADLVGIYGGPPAKDVMRWAGPVIETTLPKPP